jgi:hypothetical protein
MQGKHKDETTSRTQQREEVGCMKLLQHVTRYRLRGLRLQVHCCVTCSNFPAVKDVVVEQHLKSIHTCLGVKPCTVMRRLKCFSQPTHQALLQLSTVAHELYSKAGWTIGIS